jgi:1-deoxy-D-xylulose-5-phosphate reductoisomerase
MLHRVSKTLSVLGATGSIGQSTLDVVRRHPQRFKIHALSGQTRLEQLARDCAEFHVPYAVLPSAEGRLRLMALLAEFGATGTEVLIGQQALDTVASAPEVDTVMAAIVGAAGLMPSLAAARAGKKILLANKEALVMSGELFIQTCVDHGAIVLPIDSEHNAIFQCLPPGQVYGAAGAGIAHITLTASGGPFRQRDPATLADVTPAQAVAHPNWSMGRKISVDSATMMNKGLEVIEAHYLFKVPMTGLDVLIHPQSVIHSMVSYDDGSTLAQLGNPDMRTPIAHALAYPERIESGVKRLSLSEIARLDFEEPNLVRFPCLGLAFEALKKGGVAPNILNAANEIAVDAFLHERLGFDRIAAVCQEVLAKSNLDQFTGGIENVIEIDQNARKCAADIVKKYIR